jgi:hypothetical protein
MGVMMKNIAIAIFFGISVCAVCWMLKSCTSSLDEVRAKENTKVVVEKEKTEQLRIKYRIDSLSYSRTIDSIKNK